MENINSEEEFANETPVAESGGDGDYANGSCTSSDKVEESKIDGKEQGEEFKNENEAEISPSEPGNPPAVNFDDDLGTSPISEDSVDARPTEDSMPEPPKSQSPPQSPVKSPEKPNIPENLDSHKNPPDPEDVEMADLEESAAETIQTSEEVDVKENFELTEAEKDEETHHRNQLDPFDAGPAEPMEVDETDKAANETTNIEDEPDQSANISENVQDPPEISEQIADEEPAKEVADSFDALRTSEVASGAANSKDVIPVDLDEEEDVEEITVGQNENIEVISGQLPSQFDIENYLSKISDDALTEPPTPKLDEVQEVVQKFGSTERSPIGENEIRELEEVEETEKPCLQCTESKIPTFVLMRNEELSHLCSKDCVDSFRTANSEVEYQLSPKRIKICLILDTEQICSACEVTKSCKYKTFEEEIKFICDSDCLEKFTSNDWDKFMVEQSPFLVDNFSSSEEELQTCIKCSEGKNCIYKGSRGTDEPVFICQEDCLNALLKDQSDRFSVKQKNFRVKDLPNTTGGSATIVPESQVLDLDAASELKKKIPRSPQAAQEAKLEREKTFIRDCHRCLTMIGDVKDAIQWETHDFCSQECVFVYQQELASVCSTCHNLIEITRNSSRFIIRFGNSLKLFCKSDCLDEFKRTNFVCGFCHNLKPNEEEFKLAGFEEESVLKFCSRNCIKEYKKISGKSLKPQDVCHVCNHKKEISVNLTLEDKQFKLCSNACLSAFKFVNNVITDQCKFCDRYFERTRESSFTVYKKEEGQEGETAIVFCTNACKNLYQDKEQRLVECLWCKIKKSEFDLMKMGIKMKDGDVSVFVCSMECHQLLQLAIVQQEQQGSVIRNGCQGCLKTDKPQNFFLSMSDGTWNSFCKVACAKSFDAELEKRLDDGEALAKIVGKVKRFDKSVNVDEILGPLKPKPKPTPVPTMAIDDDSRDYHDDLPPVRQSRSPSPVISRPVGRGRRTAKNVEIKTQIITVGPPPILMANCGTMCKPRTETRGMNCRPKMAHKECQTESHLEQKFIIPVPVPIYVPTPLPMYSLPIACPVPIPIPIPVPVFIPTTRNSAQGIMKEIRKIQDKMPTDPFEAELLLMAEMVADDKKKESDSDSEPEEIDQKPTINNNGSGQVEEYQTEVPLGEDMLLMALKMAYDEPAVDLESAMTANTISQAPTHIAEEHHMQHHEQIIHHLPQHIPHQQHLMLLEQQQQKGQAGRGRKRGAATNRNSTPRGGGIVGAAANIQPRKPNRGQRDVMMPQSHEPTQREMEKSESFMCLKYTFGVNAWKQWVMTKNAELEKSSLRRKPFKSDLLQLTADELNYSLSLFVREVRKPNGSEYAPDTIYYLVLGIQQYLYENGRIDNIFTDIFYENFTNCLDEVARKFSVLYNDSQYIVTRVEEEHLWECKQLGAHSPHVLLSTLMFFNTKHFNLTTVEEHMQLSFSHIMKHWKRNPSQPGGSKVPGSRNVLLRFYPPQSALDANSRKKKVYEQQENEENPLRCPVKLYEFYLSKCPESVKTRNDVFYLMPERSCVPDSPVWYSTQALGQDALSKMLHRVKMVKEINIALLTS